MGCSVVIVGVPSAPDCAPSKTWGAAAGFVRQRLADRFGADVTVDYADLFSPELAAHPDVERLLGAGGLELPLVVVDGAVLSSGGKLNVSAIERAVAAALGGAAAAPARQASDG